MRMRRQGSTIEVERGFNTSHSPQLFYKYPTSLMHKDVVITSKATTSGEIESVIWSRLRPTEIEKKLRQSAQRPRVEVSAIQAETELEHVGKQGNIRMEMANQKTA